MLSTPSLGKLGVCLMKYSSVVQRYGIVLSSLDLAMNFPAGKQMLLGLIVPFPPTVKFSLLIYVLKV